MKAMVGGLSKGIHLCIYLGNKQTTSGISVHSISHLLGNGLPLERTVMEDIDIALGDWAEDVLSTVQEDSWEAEIYEHEWDLWDDLNEE